MHDNRTEAIHIAERIRLRVAAISGAGVAIAAAMRERAITAEEVHQLLDVIAVDLQNNADRLLQVLVDSGSG
jgi:hypothetical protein